MYCLCVCITRQVACVAAQLNTLSDVGNFLLRALKFADLTNISNGSYKLSRDVHFVSCTVSCTTVICSDFSSTKFYLNINCLFSYPGHVKKCFPSTDFFFQRKVLQLKSYRINFRNFGDERCEQAVRHVWIHFCKGSLLAYIRNVISHNPFQKLFVIGYTARIHVLWRGAWWGDIVTVGEVAGSCLTDKHKNYWNEMPNLLEVGQMPSNSSEWREVYWWTFGKSVKLKHKFCLCLEFNNKLHLDIF